MAGSERALGRGRPDFVRRPHVAPAGLDWLTPPFQPGQARPYPALTPASFERGPAQAGPATLSGRVTFLAGRRMWPEVGSWSVDAYECWGQWSRPLRVRVEQRRARRQPATWVGEGGGGSADERNRRVACLALRELGALSSVRLVSSLRAERWFDSRVVAPMVCPDVWDLGLYGTTRTGPPPSSQPPPVPVALTLTSPSPRPVSANSDVWMVVQL